MYVRVTPRVTSFCMHHKGPAFIVMYFSMAFLKAAGWAVISKLSALLLLRVCECTCVCNRLLDGLVSPYVSICFILRYIDILRDRHVNYKKTSYACCVPSGCFKSASLCSAVLCSLWTTISYCSAHLSSVLFSSLFSDLLQCLALIYNVRLCCITLAFVTSH